MRRLFFATVGIAAIMLSLGSSTPRAQAPPFNFDTGNALFGVVGPVIVPALLQTTSVNDAPFILRNVVVVNNAWFDAIAPYHPTAVSVYPRLGRRPPAESATNRHNVALIYASYRILTA